MHMYQRIKPVQARMCPRQSQYKQNGHPKGAISKHQ